MNRCGQDHSPSSGPWRQTSDYFGEFKVPGPILPVIAVSTTSGTGLEVTLVAVLPDADRAVKVGIASPHLIPHTAIYDPELTYSCPPALTASSGAYALTHAIESFTTARRALTDPIIQDHLFSRQERDQRPFRPNGNPRNRGEPQARLRCWGGNGGRPASHA